MKTLPTVDEVMKLIIKHIDKAYRVNNTNLEGSIQFCLKEENKSYNYRLDVQEDALSLVQGYSKMSTVSLRCTLSDFLNLASGKLNPVLGVITRRLKFSGNKAFFQKVMKHKNIFTIGVLKQDYFEQIETYNKNLYNPWLPPKSIIILNGGPRGNKGYTDFFLRPLIQGFKKAGANVELIYLSKMKIKDCVGCTYCANPGGDCIYDNKDDFELIYDKQFKADLVVYAFPLFMDGMPALMKKYLDRTLPTDIPGQPLDISIDRKYLRSKKNQSLMAFSTCAFPEKDNFDAIKQHMKQLYKTKSMPILEGIYRSSSTALFNNPLKYTILKNILSAIEDAGQQIVHNGKVNKNTRKVFEQIVDTRATFLDICNNYFFERMVTHDHSAY